jgi:hypothetical protein
VDTFTIILAVILVLANVLLSSFLFLLAYIFISTEMPSWPARLKILGKSTDQVLARVNRQKMAMSPAQRRKKANAYILRGAIWLVMVALVLWLVMNRG